MSSAILYLAIVAIWACVLVPRWLHRSHDAASSPENPADREEAADYAEASEHAEFGTPDESDTDAAAYLDPAPAGSAAQAGLDAYDDPPARSGYDSPARSDFAAPAGSGARSDVGQSVSPSRARPPAPAISRARIVQARRRMLTMLVTLAVAAMACVLTGLTHWWTAVPPVGMLGIYLLLLREAAQADAEASQRAESHARAQAAHARAQEAHARAYAARTARPTAEVIDISGRSAQVVDQLYDQYADATVRAVGD